MITTHFYAQDAQGNILPGADVFVYLTGTTTLATGLQTALGVALVNPFKASVTGQIQFKAPDGNYDIRVKSGPRESTLSGVQIFDGLMKFADLADPANTLAGWVRGPFAQSEKTVAGMLSAQTLNVWEKMELIPLVDKINPADPSTWYWDVAINAAMQEGRKVLLTEMFKIRNMISTKVNGAELFGNGMESTGLSLDQLGSPGASFTGTCALLLGDASVAAATTTHLGASGFSVDMGGRNIPAVVMLGARDGSYAKQIYIRDFTATAFRTNMAGDGTGVTTGKMCEGVSIEQIIAFPQNGVTGDVFQLDGIFESAVALCKAFGYTLAENNANGYAIGKNSEVRGLKLGACSAANMVKFGNALNYNRAIVYGQWARDNWDYNTTMENIEGGGVEFHGSSVSGQLLPLNCRSFDPRPFFSANAAVLNPLYKFRTASSCHATGVNHFSTVKANFQFTAENGINNRGMGDINAEPNALLGTVVVFDVGAFTSNIVKMFASGSSTRKEVTFTPDSQYWNVLPNGAYTQTDTSWTSQNLGTPNQWRWRNTALATLLEVSGTNNRVKPIAPFHAAGALVITTQTANGGGGLATYTPNMANADYHKVTFSNCTALNIAIPASLLESGKLILKLTNGLGATPITPAFNAGYAGAPADPIPAGQSALYEFRAASPTTLILLGYAINV